jgi:hypothetical protein
MNPPVPGREKRKGANWMGQKGANADSKEKIRFAVQNEIPAVNRGFGFLEDWRVSERFSEKIYLFTCEAVRTRAIKGLRNLEYEITSG